MTWEPLWHRIRSQIPDESAFDADWQAKNIVQEILRLRGIHMTDAELEESTRVRPRPVYERYLRRKHHMPLDPPTEEEKRDAIHILELEWEDELQEEALRILDEAGK